MLDEIECNISIKMDRIKLCIGITCSGSFLLLRSYSLILNNLIVINSKQQPLLVLVTRKITCMMCSIDWMGGCDSRWDWWEFYLSDSGSQRCACEIFCSYYVFRMFGSGHNKSWAQLQKNAVNCLEIKYTLTSGWIIFDSHCVEMILEVL